MSEADDQLKNQIQDRIGQHWSSITKQNLQSNVLEIWRWWNNPHCIKHISKITTGLPLITSSLASGHLIKRFAAQTPLCRGVSVGCGSGTKEMSLVSQGIVSSFELYELAEYRIEQGEKVAKKLGIENKVKFHLGDAFELIQEENSFDLVYWSASLHHMLDVDSAVRWSYEILRKGGVFCMDNDYVGPNRLQWTDRMLEIAHRIRTILPDKYLSSPQEDGKLLPRNVKRFNLEKLIANDPSEAADSESIIPSIKKYFPQGEIIPTGGVVYHVALREMLQNFQESEPIDSSVLDLLMFIDELCAELNENLYATAIAVK